MAHYDFFAVKKVSAVGAKINAIAAAKLARIFRNVGNFPQGAKPRVLEIGPGQGLFAARLRDLMAMDYKGYEPERLLFEKMQSLGFAVENSPVPPVPEHDETFDAVVLLNVLEHMPGTAAAEELVHEICRVLKKNGMLFMVVPSFLDWGRHFFNLDYTHQFVTTEYRLAQLLSDAGFTIQSTQYHYGCFFSGLGRLANLFARMGCAMITLLLPRRISRKEPVQKLAVLFAENIICIARKKS
jgi:SAM-dependent methyltransferase